MARAGLRAPCAHGLCHQASSGKWKHASPRITASSDNAPAVCPLTPPRPPGGAGGRAQRVASGYGPMALGSEGRESGLQMERDTLPSAQPQASLQKSMKLQGETLKFCCQTLQHVHGGGAMAAVSPSHLCRGHSRACPHLCVHSCQHRPQPPASYCPNQGL